jgi:hypothetical protein
MPADRAAPTQRHTWAPVRRHERDARHELERVQHRDVDEPAHEPRIGPERVVHDLEQQKAEPIDRQHPHEGMALEAPARPRLRVVEVRGQHHAEPRACRREHDLGRDPEAGVEEQAQQDRHGRRR